MGKADGTQVGQNVFIGYSINTEDKTSFTANVASAAVQTWYGKYGGYDPYWFDYGTSQLTQVVLSEITALGCAGVYYEGSGTYNSLVVCNYALGNKAPTGYEIP